MVKSPSRLGILRADWSKAMAHESISHGNDVTMAKLFF